MASTVAAYARYWIQRHALKTAAVGVIVGAMVESGFEARAMHRRALAASSHEGSVVAEDHYKRVLTHAAKQLPYGALKGAIIGATLPVSVPATIAFCAYEHIYSPRGATKP